MAFTFTPVPGDYYDANQVFVDVTGDFMGTQKTVRTYAGNLVRTIEIINQRIGKDLKERNLNLEILKGVQDAASTVKLAEMPIEETI